MRLTLDSNVLVRAVVSPQGPALRLLNLVLTDHILVLSRFILDEVERVLLYARIQTRYRTTPEEAARFSQHLGDASMLVDPECGTIDHTGGPLRRRGVVHRGARESRYSLYAKPSSFRIARGTSFLRRAPYSRHD